jgi:coenzyme F420-0:L-glutamate ligase/coenzyme F420-1:gamma-L-glutamate ligase
MTLTLTPLPGIPIIQPGVSLAAVILDAVERAAIFDVEDGDIFVIAQKVVSKAEDRFVRLREVEPSERAIVLAGQTDKDPRVIELILKESSSVLRTRPGTIVVEHRCGFICANAGIDHSNVHSDEGDESDWVLLLPEDSDQSARRIKAEIDGATGKQVGVLIIDSHGRAWRLGTVGVAIGMAGVPGLVDLRGKKDLFGYELRVTQVAAADELAAAASLVMGQASEATPVVHVRGFPFELRESRISELIRPRGQDLFR